MKAKIALIEIPALNYDRAVEFYSNVFGFEIENCFCGEESMGFLASENVKISISKSNGFLPSDRGTLVSFEVDRIEDTTSKANKFGGSVAIDKTEIIADDKSYFAVISDSEGNKIGLYSIK